MEEPSMTAIEVSPEMISLVGGGPAPSLDLPPCSVLASPVAFVVTLAAGASTGTVTFSATPSRAAFDSHDGSRVILLVAREACERILGAAPLPQDGALLHLPASLRAIALAILGCDLPEMARTPYRLAKSIELLCDLLVAQSRGDLLPIGQDPALSSADRYRLLAARRIIEERWAEKLTLDMIARTAGLNRAKLTRGFRELFDCSVADAIAEQRLGKAGQMLLSTDLPVSSIGYRCGYLNNASFTRAFARKFGQAPTHYRAGRLAA